MKNYAVVASIKAEQKGIIDDVFDKGYEQGYKDGTKAKDGERGSIYYGGYSDGYKDGQKDALKAKGEIIASEIANCKKAYEKAYEKGLKHGRELRVKEAECAEACGMKRAWETALKYLEMDDAVCNEIFGFSGWRDFFSISASEAITKIEAWEKKQEQTKKKCETCGHYCGYDNKFKCDIKGLLCIERDRWIPKQEQTEKNCDNCKYNNREKTAFPCSVCITMMNGFTMMNGCFTKWEAKEDYVQDVPKTNVGSIENRDKIVKAIAGLLAAYGEQLWDVVADMQKNP